MKFNDFKKELEERILPFWLSNYDEEYFSVYGRVDFDYNVIKNADKGCIFNSRILWFLSTCLIENIGNRNEVLDKTNKTFQFLVDHCLDEVNGGIFWSVSRKGKVIDSTKHTYNIAFGIYALSAYYRATKNKKAIKLAYDLYKVIESQCKDEKGYLESFTSDFKPLINDKLSENGVIANRTMNTLLHVLEGYSGLYEATKDKQVKTSIIEIFNIFENKVYNKEKNRQEVFFDLDYNSLIDLHSYGHDIETSWLMCWALDLIDDNKIHNKIDPLLKQLSINVLNTAIEENGGVINECENQINDETYVWWVQCESVIGFYNAYQRWNIIKAKQASINNFKFINRYMIDKRKGGEWFWDIDKNLNPTSKKDIIEEWKCPYHNGRMCFEMMRRLKNDT